MDIHLDNELKWFMSLKKYKDAVEDALSANICI